MRLFPKFLTNFEKINRPEYRKAIEKYYFSGYPGLFIIFDEAQDNNGNIINSYNSLWGSWEVNQKRFFEILMPKLEIIPFIEKNEFIRKDEFKI